MELLFCVLCYLSAWWLSGFLYFLIAASYLIRSGKQDHFTLEDLTMASLFSFVGPIVFLIAGFMICRELYDKKHTVIVYKAKSYKTNEVLGLSHKRR